MLCSHCSRSVKPIVAVDIDGTLGDYHGHFERFASEYLGKKYRLEDYLEVWNDYQGDVPYRQWFCTKYHVDVTTFREIKLAYRQGGMKRTMPVLDHAVKFTRNLRGQNIELWLTTTRPYLRLDGVDRDTREWLRRNGFEYDHLLYDEDKYDALAENIDVRRVLAVLDDEPEQLRNAERALGHGVGILALRAHNASDTWSGTGARTFDEAYSLITNRLRKWNG